MSNIIYMCVCPSCAAIKGVMGDENGNLTSNQTSCSTCGSSFINTKVPVTEYMSMEKESRESWAAEMRAKYAPNVSQDVINERIRETKRTIEMLKNRPTCPTCGSVSIRHLQPYENSFYLANTTGNANKAGKTFICENCGYTW